MELKEEIDKITVPLLTFGGEQYRDKVEVLVTQFLSSLEEVVGILRRALLFMLMKVLNLPCHACMYTSHTCMLLHMCITCCCMLL